MKYKIVEYPGYLGSKKGIRYKIWNDKYNKWKICWIFEGRIVNFDEIFWKVYVAGYTKYFIDNYEEAKYLTTKYAFSYDKDLITKENAFKYKYLLNKKKFNNQFHHSALNYALKYNLNLDFKGKIPVQVRSKNTEGYKWNPGFIPCSIKFSEKPVSGWWKNNSIESYYQSHKVLLALN